MKKYVPTIKKNPTRPDHKFCTKCYIEKPFTEFKPYKHGRFGLHSWCQPCFSSYQALRRPPKPPIGLKKCRGCYEIKEANLDNFQKSAVNKGGLNPRCKTCTTAKYHAKKRLVEFDKRTRVGRTALGLGPAIRASKPTHKACKKCGVQAPLDEFRPPHGKRGYLNCAECRKKAVYQKTGKPAGRVSQVEIGQLFECKKCNTLKPFTTDFFGKDATKCHGMSYQCLDCKNVYRREYSKKINSCPKKKRKYNSLTRKNYRERIRLDPIFRLRKNIQRRLQQAFKSRSHKKNCKTVEVLGCSFKEFKKHLESQFKPGMTWENYGLGPDKWNIDHFYPLSAAKTVEEVIKLNHYTNLRPMWQIDNMAKRDTIPKDWNPLQRS